MISMQQAITEGLAQEMERDGTIYLFGEDICYGGLDGVTAGLQGRFGSDRVFDTPISESGIAGLAVGAALMGTRPVVEMQFTGLITVALDQIANSGAKARYVHDGGMSAPMVVRTVTYPSGNVYIGQSLEAWVAHVPGLKVVAPSTPADAKGLLVASIRDPDPVVFIEHKDLYDTTGPVSEELYETPFKHARLVRQGADVTVVAWLSAVPLVEEAAQDLAAEGVDVEILDPRTLVPFDLGAVVESVKKTGRLVVVQEAVRRLGFGAEVAAAVAGSDAFSGLKAPIMRVGNPGVPVPHGKHLNKYILPTKDDVVDAVRRSVGYR